MRQFPAPPAGPLVALVGAPNVGKSTLFNRLIGSRRAIVTDRPGITRDRIYGRVRTGGRVFALCDTGGLVTGTEDRMQEMVRRQTEEAIRESALLLFVVDARAGLTGLDLDLARMLRAQGKPVALVVNKVEEPEKLAGWAEFHQMGFARVVAVSAEHGLGIAELIDHVEEILGPLPMEGEDPAGEEISIAVVGRPNVGKSSLLNRLLRQDRLTVSEIPGTTRDAVDILVSRPGGRYRFIDTAGIRRKGKTTDHADILSVVSARRSLERAGVVVVVLDASAPLTAQDQTIAGYVFDARRPLILVANKWDLVAEPEERTASLRQEVAERFRFTPWAPLLTVSAGTGQRVEKLLPLIDEVARASLRRLTTPELNRFLKEEGSSGRGPRLLYITQTGTGPPAFVLFTRDAPSVHFSVRRRLENRIRERFSLGPTPIVLKLRSRSGGKARQ